MSLSLPRRSVYNGGFSQESRRSGSLNFPKNSFSRNKVYVTHFNKTLVWFIILDMAAERNALMERIYPRLKEFAQEKGYEFQVGLIKGNYLLFCKFYSRHDIPCVLDIGNGGILDKAADKPCKSGSLCLSGFAVAIFFLSIFSSSSSTFHLLKVVGSIVRNCLLYHAIPIPYSGG